MQCELCKESQHHFPLVLVKRQHINENIMKENDKHGITQKRLAISDSISF